MSDDSRIPSAFAKLLDVVLELRQRCPWDREQKLADTPRHLIEEAYEVADAIERGRPADIAEELGDLMVQSLFIAVILAEEKEFGIDRVMNDAAEKMIRRHPHVYGESRADNLDQALESWEQIKQKERADAGKPRIKSLAHVGRALPSMMRAEKLGEKARRAGMDWRDVREVLAKVREEIDEVERALDQGDTKSASEEIGDMMLAIANVPRFLGKNAEQTIRAACDKFVARF
ncbi:MAG: mazG, partial [Candidatus Binatus sp.]|nr:mazG [Candidatus Binatus sp.]